MDDKQYILTGNDAISILLFGTLYFIFAYVVVFAYYFKGIRKIAEGRTSLSSVLLKAFIFQVISLVFVWALLLGMNIFVKYSSFSGISFTKAVLIFFKGNWLNFKVSTFVNTLSSNGMPITIAGIFLIIQTLWIVITLLFILFPIVIIVGASYAELKTHEGQLQTTSQAAIIVSILKTIFLTMIIFAIHFNLPAVFLQGMAGDSEANNANNENLSYEKIMKDNNIPEVDNFTYQARVKAFIKSSLNINNSNSNNNQH